MKTILNLCLCLLLACPSAFADNYRVLLINKGEVSINGKTIQKDDTFSDKDTIEWADNTQAIKAINLTTNKTIVLAAAQMKKADCTNLLEYVIFTNQLSVRDYAQSYSYTEQYLLDTLSLSLPVTPEDINDINIVYLQFGKRIKKNLQIYGNDAIITRQLLDNITTESIKIDVECILKDDTVPLPLIEKMTIHLL